MRSDTEEVSIDFHAGEALWSFATTYPTLDLCLIETIQNGIDAGAKLIFVGVDLMERRVAVCDNGTGVSPEKFAQALQSVGMGIKSSEAIGRFGRGLVSPLPLAQTMTFISKPEGGDAVNSWLFIGEQLRRQRSGLKVPRTSYEHFPQLPEPFTHAHTEAKLASGPTRFRTMVLLDRVTEDKTLTLVDPEDFEIRLLGKLRRPMREKDVTVFLKVRDVRGRVRSRKITATNFTGEPLEEVVFTAANVGKVTFRLFKARLSGGKRRGQVEFFQEGDPSSAGAKEFRAQAMGLGWYGGDAPESVTKGIDALYGGVFEGEVSAQGIELHPERKKFEQGDALTDLYALIGDWYEKHGCAYLNDEQEQRAEQRYRKLGEQSLERLMDAFANNPAFAQLSRDLRGLLPAIPGSQGPKPERKKSDQSATSPRSRRVVVDPKEPSRRQGQRTGGFLTFAYELLRGSARLWEYDHETGVLTLNIRHYLWGRVDKTGKQNPKTDKQLMHLQEWLALKLLLLLGTGIKPSEIDLHRLSIDQELEYYIEVFVLR